jgi:endonuclease/exonuclease/phosphatase family metal-dependent hydrolase
MSDASDPIVGSRRRLWTVCGESVRREPSPRRGWRVGYRGGVRDRAGRVVAVRVGTFNANNLFSRWNFRTVLSDTTPMAPADTSMVVHGDVPAVTAATATSADPLPAPQVVPVKVGDTVLTGVLRTFDGRLVQGKDAKARAWIARRIAALAADVLALQEVEDQDALDAFDRDELTPLGASYPFRAVIEGNDPRRIDVAIASRIPLGRVSSWRFRPDPDDAGGRVFSRDLLQVELRTSSRPVHLFINHLKSNFITDEFRLSAAQRQAAREAITRRRTRQAETVATIIDSLRLRSRIIVLGDMNDDPTSPCLAPFADSGLVEHITHATTLPGPNRAGTLIGDRFSNLSAAAWTHRFKPTGPAIFSLYDQIWTSPDLASNVTAGWIMRRTLIGGDGSDHDPAAIDLNL